MKPLRLFLIVFLLLASRPAAAQTASTETVNPLRGEMNGFALRSVTFYSGYFSSPQAYNGAVSMGNTEPDLGYGVGASLSWRHLRRGSGVSVSYQPSYNGFRRYSNLNAFNHNFSLGIHNRWDPGRKWHTGLSAEAGANTNTQFLFAPTALERLVNTPASFDQLAQGVASGRFANEQIASILTGAAMPQSPAELVLYGDYYFSAGLQALALYSPSSRLSVGLVAMGRRFQSLPRDRDNGIHRSILPGSTSASATVQLGYSFSPRTRLQFDLGSTRTFSRAIDSYSTSTTVGLNRIMSRRWFVQGRLGTALITPVRQALPAPPQRPNAVGGAGLGFKTENHSIVIQSALTRSDPYGVGAMKTLSTALAWSWRPLRTRWAAQAGGNWQQLKTGGVTLMESWSSRVTIGRALTRETGFSVGYAYLSNRGALAVTVANPSMHALTLGFYWIPGGEKRARAR